MKFSGFVVSNSESGGGGGGEGVHLVCSRVVQKICRVSSWSEAFYKGGGA